MGGVDRSLSDVSDIGLWALDGMSKVDFPKIPQIRRRHRFSEFHSNPKSTSLTNFRSLQSKDSVAQFSKLFRLQLLPPPLKGFPIT
ncbi:hypothetical protein L1987_51674 [Smallanthus sonchifolius]|uniref:Uncharacterized protein n=1 Tax=Smallanthus sonchifolius TaxID=185202 RepID=A0ACB9ES45_9ASTR|nr:hypothetical protein L1987_51674 [Smallanthus sonchifolius]